MSGKIPEVMSYVLTAILSLLVAFVVAFVWVFISIPSGEGAFGVAKAIPLFVGLGTIMFFGIGWFPATLIVFITDRARKRGTTYVVVITSGLAFIASSFALYSAHRSNAVDLKIQQIRSQAAAATNNFQIFDPVIAGYCSESRHGYYPQTKYHTVISALLENPSTPPEALEKLANGLDDGHEVLKWIATHPNCSPQLISRFNNIAEFHEYLAKNPRASPELLEALSLSTNEMVRARVAQNTQTPRWLIERLLQDPKPLVRNCATNRVREFSRDSSHP